MTNVWFAFVLMYLESAQQKIWWHFIQIWFSVFAKIGRIWFKFTKIRLYICPIYSLFIFPPKTSFSYPMRQTISMEIFGIWYIKMNFYRKQLELKLPKRNPITCIVELLFTLCLSNTLNNLRIRSKYAFDIPKT